MLALPLLAIWSLLAVKLSVGESLRRAQQQFFLAMTLVGLVTLHTVASLDDAWLPHMTTLGAMVVGACVIPSRSAAQPA